MYLRSNFIKEAQNFIIIKHDEKYITYGKYQQWITAVSATTLIVGDVDLDVGHVLPRTEVKQL